MEEGFASDFFLVAMALLTTSFPPALYKNSMRTLEQVQAFLPFLTIEIFLIFLLVM